MSVVSVCGVGVSLFSEGVSGFFCISCITHSSIRGAYSCVHLNAKLFEFTCDEIKQIKSVPGLSQKHSIIKQ